MMTKVQKDLLDDLKAPTSYGRPLIGWKGHLEFYKDPRAPATPGPLSASLAATFIEESYFLLAIQRPVRVYRGYETQGLRAPYGVDHPSFALGLVQSRRPGTPDGWWWTPARPSKSVDNLGLSSAHRSEDRAGSAVKLEWNRIDFWLEAELPVGAVVYVGRAAAQQESTLYGGRKYGGGGIQFRLTNPPQTAFAWMKRYAAA